MLEELARVKEYFKKVNKEISFWNFCKKKLLFCCMEIILVFMVLFIVQQNKHNLFLLLILLIIFFFLIYFHLKKFTKEIFSQEGIEKIEGYSEYWLDFKYQKLRKCLEEKMGILESTKISKYIDLLTDEYKSKHINFIERNPVFSISFTIFIAILSSGIMSKGSDLVFVAFLFLLSIMGMIVSVLIHPLFSFNNEKQLIFLLTLLEKELNNNGG